jgi:protein tyrosine/serine phosphatase
LRQTAGKDRTGILAALILGLTGAPPEAIAMDYALTRIGVEPAHEQLLAVLQSQTGFSFDQPGFVEMCSIQSKTMLSFLEMLDERWDGVEGYVKGGLGLEDVDIELIKENLRGKR